MGSRIKIIERLLFCRRPKFTEKTSLASMAPVNMTGAVVAAAALLMLSSYSFFRLSEKKKKRKDKLSMRNGLVDAIGNTPLIRINSLSEATGCEVFLDVLFYFRFDLIV